MQDQFLHFKELALGSRLKRLSDHLMKDTSKIYNKLSLNFDPYLMPIFKLVSEQNNLTIGELSNLLKVTQPAITQFVNQLVKKKLIVAKTGKIDKRKRKISITKNGEKLLLQLAPVWKAIDSQLKTLTHNTANKTLLEHITYVENELKKESFFNKVLKNVTNTVSIINFEDHLSNYFRDLNIEWLEKYFTIENHDREVLENANTYIINNNGYIFFAKYKNEIVGTVALVNEEEGYELSKMAVSPNYQGLKIGQQLLQHCISFAKKKKWNELILYSNTVLENAIYIYKKFGFVEVPLEATSPYKRSDIKMKLTL